MRQSALYCISVKPHPTLTRLGNRVRELRLARGWTLRTLALRSGLSTRFLSDLEAGRGNISILRLVSLAQSLEVEPIQLLPTSDRPASPRDQAHSMIGRLPETDLHDALTWLRDRLGDSEQPIIALVGLRGAGKSTIGKALAKRLDVKFIELDAMIERESNLSLSELFSLHGEPYYKRLAQDLLVRVFSENQSVVIAIGGSVVTDSDTWALLKRRCHTVWLKASPEDHWKRVLGQGDTRPMANRASAMSELRSILALRSPLYAEARQTIDTSAVRALEAVRMIAADRLFRNRTQRGARRTKGEPRSLATD